MNFYTAEDGHVYNDDKKNSGSHHGSVKPTSGIKLKKNKGIAVSENKGLDKESIRFIDEFDKAQKFGELNYHNNGDFVNGGGFSGDKLNIQFVPENELNIPEEELRLTGGDKKKYIQTALFGKTREQLDIDEKISKQQRKEQQRRWNEIIHSNSTNPRIRRQLEIEDILVKWNERFQQNYERTNSFFRGTSPEEIIAMQEDDGIHDGVVAVESKGYNYYPVSMDPMIGTNRFGSGGGITIEFDGNSVRDAKSTVVEYTSYPVPLGNSKSVVSSASNHGKEMNYKFMDEMEIRVPQYAHLKIKNLFVNKEIFDSNPYLFKRLVREKVPVHIVKEVNEMDLKHGKWKEIPVDWEKL